MSFCAIIFFTFSVLSFRCSDQELIMVPSLNTVTIKTGEFFPLHTKLLGSMTMGFPSPT